MTIKSLILSVLVVFVVTTSFAQANLLNAKSPEENWSENRITDVS
jgi:biopolymer transport protein ExbD